MLPPNRKMQRPHRRSGELEYDRVKGEEHLPAECRQRVRDVRPRPDGALYLVTDERNGEVWREVWKMVPGATPSH
jgi:glucose/arabinose dehydrogenase